MKHATRTARPTYRRALVNTLAVFIAVLSVAAVPVPQAFPTVADDIATSSTRVITWPATIPGQPNGIPEHVNGEGWRFRQGNICFEDWTGGWAADAIQYQAAQYSRSGDVNGYYRVKTNTTSPCEDAGFDNSTKITFVLNTDYHCDQFDGAGQAHIWTEGGYLVPNYLVTRAVVWFLPNCPGWWGAGVPADQAAKNKRMVAGHEAGHAFGFAHQEFPVCATTAPQSWKCRPDTIMAADARYQWWLSTWDVEVRLDGIHPW